MPPFPTQRCKLLCAYLILHRDLPVPRDVLAGTLWGDEPDATARAHLRTELWRLRAILEPRGVPRGRFLRAGKQQIALSTTGCWVDVEEFEREVRAGVTAGDRLGAEGAAALRQAVDLYRGDLLEGVYERWALEARARCKSLLCDGLESLTQFHAGRAEWAEAIGYGERVLSADPFLEHVHRELMRLHYALGDRPAALRQYQVCRDFLRRDLGVDPMPETQRLYESIRSPQGVPRRATPARPWEPPDQSTNKSIM